MRQKNIIFMMGDWCTWSNQYGSTSNITTDLLFPTRIIPVHSVANFKPGDDIIVRNDGTTSFIEEHGMAGIWENWAARVMFLRRIDSVNVEKNLIYIDSPTRYYLKTRDNARVYHAKKHITECGIESLSIGNVQNNKTGWGEETYTSSGTGAYDVHASHVIYIKYAQNCWVKNVNTFKPQSNTEDIHVLSNCLLINQSRGVTADSCFFQKPQYEGGGGNGYMFTLSANDCLIKNSRANHSRHNYDFKFPYSNGNVIHNCIAENSKYSSDFHMYLSMANLFDVTTVNKDYLESMFRPWGGSVIHGYSSTQSVFYNTNGVAYHPQRDYIIDSRQFKTGYVIGTSGDAYKVKLDPVSGTTNGYAFDTAPRDYAEGIGEGEGLMPKSLYLDQLEKRLNDTTGLANYSVSIKVKHAFTNAPLLESVVQLDGKKDTTDLTGTASFGKLSSLFNVNITKPGFYPIFNMQVNIYSDTTLVFSLTPKEYNVTFVVHDKLSGQTFGGTPVLFNGLNEATNDQGQAFFRVYEGSFDYFIEKNSYQNVSGTLKVESDTTVHFYLTRSSAFVKFRIKEGTTPVNDAAVVLNSDTLVSTSIGLATFRDLQVEENYSYKIVKGGYNDVTGELYLESDTTLEIQLEQYPVSAGNILERKLKIWPNPANNYLMVRFENTVSEGVLQVLNLNGNSIKNRRVTNSSDTKIDLTGITPGFYLLKFTSNQNQFFQSFLKQ